MHSDAMLGKGENCGYEIIHQLEEKNGASHRTRTDDLIITNDLLYQLS